MEQSARSSITPTRSLEDFIATIKAKGLQLAIITPTAPFIGTHLAEALLAQNLAVLCEVTDSANAQEYTKHLQYSTQFFLLEHSHQHGLPINLPSPSFVIYDIDESFRHFSDTDDISFTISLETKRLLEYTEAHKAKFLLLSAIDTEQYDPLLHTLPSANKLVLEQKKHYQELKRFVTTLLTESIEKSKLDARVIQHAAVFGPRMDLSQEHLLTKMLQQALDKRLITLSGDGLQSVRPLYISDFIYGVIKTLFTPSTKGKTYTLLSPQSVTLLSLATAIQQAAAELELPVAVEFAASETNDHYTMPFPYSDAAEKELVWSAKIDVKQGLLRTMHFFLAQQPSAVAKAGATPVLRGNPRKVEPAPTEAIVPFHQTAIVPVKKSRMFSLLPKLRRKTTPPPAASFVPQPAASTTKTNNWQQKPSFLSDTTTTVRKQFGKRYVGIGAILLVVLTLIGAIVFIPPAINDRLAASNKQAIAAVLADSNNPNTVAHAQKTTRQMKHFGVLPLASWRHNAEARRQQQLALTTIGHQLASMQATNQAYAHLDGLLAIHGGSATKKLQDASIEQRVAQENSMLASAEVKLLLPSTPLHGEATQLQTQPKVQPTSSRQLTATIGLLTQLYTAKKEQTFAVLLADNNELRPTGGKTDALLSITIRNSGKPEIASHNPNHPRLTLTTDAPQAVKTYLRHSKLTLEDSLWHRSLEESVTPFMADLTTVIGKPLDGVITLDLTALRELLTLSGPVTLKQFTTNANQPLVITYENFPEQLTQLYQLTTRTSGQTRDAFGTELSKAILSQLLEQQFSFAAFSQQIRELYAQQHVLVHFTNPSLRKITQTYNWNTITQPTTPLFFGVYDANVGLNKTNQVVTRTIHHDIFVTNALTVSERLVITYTNQSETTQWPFGTYQSYTQVALPTTARVARVLIDDKRPTAPVDEALTATSKTVGTLMSVKPNEKAVLTIEYQHPIPLSLIGKIAQLQITALQQPGTLGDPYEIAVQLPKSLQPTKTMPEFEQFSDGILLKDNLTTKKVFTIDLTQVQ